MGVMFGNWTGDYSGGRAPCAWGSSPAILDEYMKDSRAMKWGQCFMYSAIMTSGE